MCNEIEEKLIATYMGTIIEPDKDPVEITLYPIFPKVNHSDVIHGFYSRDNLVRAGIHLEEYGEFLVDHWESSGGSIFMVMRPSICRELTNAECTEIKRKIDEAFPEGAFDDY